MRAILSAFSYNDHITPEFIRNDLHIVVNYLMSSLKVDPKRIYILTDIPVQEYKSDELDTITSGNVVEYFKEIGNYIHIKGRQEFVGSLSQWLNSFTKCKLFMYFTGHAIPNGFLIPKKDDYSPLPDLVFTNLISNLDSSVELFIVLDCCYAETIIPLKVVHTINGDKYNSMNSSIKCKIIILGSSLSNEKSGFHQGNKCSLFTLHCFNFLSNLNNTLFYHFLNIGWRINRYRVRYRKPRQNVFISTNSERGFFPWIMLK